MEKIIINFNDENKRIDNFLCKYYSQLTKTMVFKLIRTNKVKVNNKKVKFNYRLQLHDEITIYYNFDKVQEDNDSELWFLSSKTKLDIIYEDENIVLINKPISLPSQPDSQNKDSVQKAYLKYMFDSKQYDPSKENTFVPSICNRLDTNTAGIIIAAKNASTLNQINELLKNHDIIKKYQCLVIGDIQPSSATLTAYHYKDAAKNLVYISKDPKPGYKEMITKYKKLDFNGKYSLLDVELVTGRTHQIRAHFNFIGYPLVGETKYKSKHTNADTRFKQQALVSYYLKFVIKDQKSHLYYLNNKEFKLRDIWFKDMFN